MVNAHLSKPGLRFPAVAGEKHPGAVCVLAWLKLIRGVLRFGAWRSILKRNSPRCGVGRFRLLFTLCTAGVLPCQLAGGQTSVEAFKSFVQDPPTIAKMVAKVCNLEGTNTEPACYYVLLRYQTNGFYYREAPWLDDLFATNVFPGFRFAGYYENEYWNFGYDGVSLEFSTNRESSLVATLGHVFTKASSVINLGMFDLFPGSISWGDNSAFSVTNRLGVRFEGSLVFSNGELPTGLVLMTDYEGNRVPWELKYGYRRTESVPEYLPTTISAESLGNGIRKAQYEVQLLTVELAPEPLSREHFSPNGYGDRVPYQILSTQSGHFGRDKLNKDFKPLSATGGTRPVGKNWIRLILALCLILPCTAIFVYGMNRTKNKAKQAK